MKKIFAAFLTTAAFTAVCPVVFAYNDYNFSKTRHEGYIKTVNYNEGYTGAQAQAAGGYANVSRAKNTRGGFIADDASTDFTTVLKAKKIEDGACVRLKGKIISKIGNEKYTFKDNTGAIQIEIDDDVWKDIKASSKDLVIIEGEIDKDWNEISIDVGIIELAK